MTPPDGHPAERRRAAIEIAAASAGMVVFASAAHHGLPWPAVSAAGFLLAVIVISRSLTARTDPAGLLGLRGLSTRVALASAAGIVFGLAGGWLDRKTMDLPLAAAGDIQAFAIVACLVGATEELIYRGWAIGRARVFGAPAATVVAAAAHSAYKTALFAWPAVPVPVDLASLALWTFAAGLLLGTLRAVSGSVLPAMLAHAAFDFLVYGALAHAPWWVWG